MKTLKNFTNTLDFFEYVDSLIRKNRKKAAGELAEEFWGHWHKINSDYVEVYNTNDVESIPYEILEKINAVSLLSSKKDSFGIDKICITRTGEIDIHQDKSALLGDKNASAKLAEGMMSLKDHPLKNVRYYILNTTYKDVSAYFEVWEGDKPLVYKFSDFVPSDDNEEEVEQDKKLWEFINSVDSFNYVAPPFTSFVPRNKWQTEYVDTTIKLLTQQFDNTGSAKGYNKGAGALGKSVLDPVIMARLQNTRWNESATNTPAPVNVSFFHSSKTINDNGSTEVRIRKSEGIYDKVIIVSGTDVTDDDEGSDLTEKFEKTTNAVKTVEKILEALHKGQSVLLLTLYHHSPIIEEVNRLLKKEYKGFKFWARKRDECDWPCSNFYSSFAPSLDTRTDSVITFGSSGTDRFGDPLKDYGTNNQDIHGSLLYEFTWAQAEKSGLVKPLVLVTPTIKMSDIVSIYPDIVDKDGNLDYTRTVDGIPVDKDYYPTVLDIVKIVGVQKAMVEHPAIKRTLMFSGRVKKNQLIKKNWKWIAEKHLGNSKLEKQIKNLHFEIINDDKYNKDSFKSNHNLAIKKAKSKDNYVLGSCRVFNRGYNDVAPNGYKGEWLKHNAGFHITAKTEVNLVQEIWRFTRLDDCDSDKFSYYICPLVLNDINDEEVSWEESSIDILKNIFKCNRNIADEFVSMAKSGATKNQRTQGTQLKFVLPEDFDPSQFEHLVNIIAHKSKGTVFPTMAREAHDWITNQYLKMEEPENAQTKGKIHKQFYKIAKFKPLYALNKNKIVWRERFYHRPKESLGVDTWRHCNDNLIQYKKYCAQQKKHMAQKKANIRQIVSDCLKTQFLHHNNFASYNMVLGKKYGVENNVCHNWTGAFCMDIIKSNKTKKQIDANTKKVYKYMLSIALECECMPEVGHRVYDALTDLGLDNTAVNITTIRNNFVKKSTRRDINKHLTKAEIKKLDDALAVVKLRGLILGKPTVTQENLNPDNWTKDQHRERISNIEQYIFLMNRPRYVAPERVILNPCPEERKKKIGLAIKKAYAKKAKV